MANTKVSALSAATTLANTDLLLVATDNGDTTFTSKKAAVSVARAMKQEMYKISATNISDGYFTISTAPSLESSVSIFIVGGVVQVNNDCLGSSTATGDYEVDSTLTNKKIFIRNGKVGGPVNLSEDILENDILIVLYS